MESTAPSSASRTPTDDNVDGSAPKADYLSEEEITIKLKYLNDSMKIVKARPSEPIGDFKKWVASHPHTVSITWINNVL